jgi:hypothetical protein
MSVSGGWLGMARTRVTGCPGVTCCVIAAGCPLLLGREIVIGRMAGLRDTGIGGSTPIGVRDVRSHELMI